MQFILMLCKLFHSYITLPTNQESLDCEIKMHSKLMIYIKQN